MGGLRNKSPTQPAFWRGLLPANRAPQRSIATITIPDHHQTAKSTTTPTKANIATPNAPFETAPRNPIVVPAPDASL
ncbi:uncharacterized protein BO88DRAFT_408810 [Aspergillus vadensis CBS 113365]|nr:hypothetical protein BO88DRAFT_408810 [Aspergillus vadensis CBS 113365]PYH63953.1 hypothetical protein BO88DRAFT_408810 [Aspergillus vadensis CBS 113365]